MQLLKFKEKNILFLSDTHGKHRLLDIDDNIDIVIHCGDICDDGNIDEIMDFFKWYADLKIPYKIFVNGNHDLPFELEPEMSKKLIPKNIYWLNGESVTIFGIKIMSIGQLFFNQSFESNEEIDILLSHYPPLGILDNQFGFEEIKNCVNSLKPKYHVFGHNHSDPGQVKIGKINYINASNYNEICQKKNLFPGQC